MKKGDDLKPNQPARVLGGAFAGAVGQCLSVDKDKGSAVVHLDGIWNGKTINLKLVTKLGNLGRPIHD